MVGVLVVCSTSELRIGVSTPLTSIFSSSVALDFVRTASGGSGIFGKHNIPSANSGVGGQGFSDSAPAVDVDVTGGGGSGGAEVVTVAAAGPVEVGGTFHAQLLGQYHSQ